MAFPADCIVTSSELTIGCLSDADTPSFFSAIKLNNTSEIRTMTGGACMRARARLRVHVCVCEVSHSERSFFFRVSMAFICRTKGLYAALVIDYNKVEQESNLSVCVLQLILSRPLGKSVVSILPIFCSSCHGVTILPSHSHSVKESLRLLI